MGFKGDGARNLPSFNRFGARLKVILYVFEISYPHTPFFEKE
jgi:hypothetical protein